MPILPQILAHFAAQPGASFTVRLLVSVIGPTAIIGAPVAGIFSLRFGERRMVLAATLAFGVAGCAGFILDNMYAVLASRIVLGLSVAATSTLTTAILSKLYLGQARNRWLGYYGTSGGIVALILLPLCGFLGAINWRLVFLTHAVAFPLALLFRVALPADQPRPAPARSESSTIPRVRAALPWVLIATGLTCGCISSSGSLFLPFHLATLGVTDASKIGVLLLPSAITSVMGAFAFGKIRARLSTSATFALAFSLVGVGLLSVGLTTSLNTAIAMLAVSGFGIGMIVPNMLAMAAALSTDADRSRLFGFTKGAYFAGPLLSQVALEPMARYVSATAAILTVGIFALVCGLWNMRRVRSLPGAAVT